MHIFILYLLVVHAESKHLTIFNPFLQTLIGHGFHFCFNAFLSEETATFSCWLLRCAVLACNYSSHAVGKCFCLWLWILCVCSSLPGCQFRVITQSHTHFTALLLASARLPCCMFHLKVPPQPPWPHLISDVGLE